MVYCIYYISIVNTDLTDPLVPTTINIYSHRLYFDSCINYLDIMLTSFDTRTE